MEENRDSGNSQPPVELLVASPREEYRNHFLKLLEKLGGINLVWFKSNLEMVDNAHLAQNPVLAIIDSESSKESAMEWLQNLRITYPKCGAMVCYYNIAPSSIEELNKNGAMEVFHLYYDSDFIETHIAKQLPPDFLLHKVPISLLMPIHLQDLEVNTELSFDAYVHLPTNKKTILLKRQGQILDKATLDKFLEKNAQLYIKKSQLRKYLDYSVTVASMKSGNTSRGSLLNADKIKRTMQQITWDLFNNKPHQFQDGKAVLDRALHLIHDVQLCKDLPTKELGSAFMEVCGNTRSVYNDIVGVSTLSALICQALGINPIQKEATALGALFHNIGLGKIGPFELYPGYEKNHPEFQKYPAQSLTILSEKKVPLSRDILAAIEQHREHVDGTGFPQGKNLNNLGIMPKILRLALRIQELTSLHSNDVECFGPKSALAFLKTEALSGASPHDLNMIMELTKNVQNISK